MECTNAHQKNIYDDNTRLMTMILRQWIIKQWNYIFFNQNKMLIEMNNQKTIGN